MAFCGTPPFASEGLGNHFSLLNSFGTSVDGEASLLHLDAAAAIPVLVALSLMISVHPGDLIYRMHNVTAQNIVQCSTISLVINNSLVENLRVS